MNVAEGLPHDENIWLKIARMLPDAREKDKRAFEIRDRRLEAIRNEETDNVERLMRVLKDWKDISDLHNKRRLYDVLYTDYGAVAEQYLQT